MPVGLRQRITEFFTSSGTASERSPDVIGPAAALAEARSATSTLGKPAEWQIISGGGTTAAGVSVSPESAQNLSSVFACLSLRSTVLASLPLKLYRKTGKGREEVSDHPAGQLFTGAPNGAQTSFTFRAQGQRRVDTRGNCYARIVRDSFYRPVALVPIRPADVEPILTASGDAVYRVAGELLTRADILHVPGVDLAEDGLRGIAPITRMREALGLASATHQQAARWMANDATPPIAISLKEGKLTDAQIANLRAQWAERYGGANRGMPAVLQNGATVERLGFTAAEAQMLESRKFDVEEFARYYGVPLALIQSTEKSTSWGSGIYELVQGFVKFTISPICINWEERLNMSLLTEQERAGGYYFAFVLEGLLRGDLKARAEANKIMREWGILSANEWRRLEELADLPDAQGDTYLTPLNYAINGRAPASAPDSTPADASPA